ncbi:hypothetical protein EA462_09110 [Natrarchaeobius halalkaliphilus]|uniref:Amphi-Trp domain-containing protein n=1 Tax=Natrarchaeobius halalkaliphilus TaxID=1679091 RepID=A0A3N6LMB5_9EURY|nr:hypothetical protein [Natrarchaeobius halalkaliphilus]RQG90138.1 hypothetical protein EA462_09110 [Natrarchaeobius halalkaliphilus]
MDSNHTSSPPTDATERFERDLEELITTAFARGAAVEATWMVTTPVADAPDWSITIEKEYSRTESGFEPRFLEE